MEGIPRPSSNERFQRPQLELEQVTTPEKFLKAIDFNAINDIFDDLARKASGESGEVHTTGHRVTPENISFDRPHFLEVLRLRKPEQKTLRGSADVPRGNIELTWDLKDRKRHEDYRTVDLLRTLLHESAHVRGAYKSEGESRGSWDEGNMESETQSQIGLQKGTSRFSSQEGLVTDVQGVSLNEAITETIANDILPEYLTRTGNTGFLKDPRLLQELGPGAYIADRVLLQLVIEKLAEKFEVDRDLVWRGFVQAYMTGSTSLPELFADIYMALDYGGNYEDFPIIRALGALRGSDGAGHIYRIDDVLDFIKNQPELQHTILNRLDHAVDTEKFGHALGLR